MGKVLPAVNAHLVAAESGVVFAVRHVVLGFCAQGVATSAYFLSLSTELVKLTDPVKSYQFKEIDT